VIIHQVTDVVRHSTVGLRSNSYYGQRLPKHKVVSEIYKFRMFRKDSDNPKLHS